MSCVKAASLSACYHSSKVAELTITIYADHCVEFRYLDDDGQMVVSRDVSVAASTLRLNAEEKMEISNICVALKGVICYDS